MTGMFRSFRARIFWAILLVAAVAAGLSLWLTREWLEERQLDEARTGLLREARVAGELLLRGENDLEVLARVLDLPDLRLSLLDADGKVLAETGGVSPEGMDNHGDRPEVVQARSEGQGYSLRASGTLHKNFAYAARNLPDGRILRLALPLDSVNLLIQKRLHVFAPMILLAVVLAKMMHKNDEPQQKIDTADDFVRAVTPVLQSETDLLAEQLRAMQGESARTTTATLRDFSAVLAENQRQNAAASTARLESIDRAGAARQKAANDALLAQLTMMETRLKNLEDSNATRMDSVRGALVQGLNTIRADNNKKLDEIRGTVEEKLQDTLQQRINDSFKTVSAQLEQVYKGLGEMQNLAADVGSLKQVLSGVKTRGILGEVQLGAILEQILAPGQYACNVATVPGSTNRVEYAIKMPGQNGTVWLPIDAKFPGDTYAHLQAAQERGDAAAVAAMRKALNNVLRAEAKDIHDKYIEVPYTTSFGILFLPFEGLYAEVVSSGVTELLQRDYQITVAGPSTMAALLNALQMGFRTLAIQKRSGEVWTILGAVCQDRI